MKSASTYAPALALALVLSCFSFTCSESAEDDPFPASAAYISKVSAGVTLSLFTFDEMDCEIAVFANPDRKGAKNLSEWGQQTKALAVCNGGYFDPGPLLPSGLEISNGIATGKQTTGDPHVGNLLVTPSATSLIWDGELLDLTDARHFLQCSPWLVSEGRTYQPSTPNEDEPRAFRTFIMTNGQGRWCIGITSRVTLSGLARILTKSDLLPNFTVKRALNLDGGPSTGLWVKGKEAELKTQQPKWPVRNGVLVRPRKTQ